MNINIPGLAESLALTKELPAQFDTLISRMDRIVELLEETNEILRSK